MTKEQYEAWRTLPETEDVLNKVGAEIKDLAENMANGGTLNSDSAELTAMNTAKAVGEIRGLTFVLSDLWDSE